MRRITLAALVPFAPATLLPCLPAALGTVQLPRSFVPERPHSGLCSAFKRVWSPVPVNPVVEDGRVATRAAARCRNRSHSSRKCQQATISGATNAFPS